MQSQALQDKFAELYSAHRGYVTRLLLRMVRDPDVAEDLAQETFLRAWRAFGRWEARAQFRTWLTTIAVHVAVNHFRRMKRTKRAITLPLRTAGARIQADVGREGFADVDAALVEGLRGIHGSYRRQFLLYANGHSEKEMAAMLNLTVKAVKARNLRTRRSLQDYVWMKSPRPLMSITAGKEMG